MSQRRLFVGFALLVLAVSAFMQVRTGNASDKNWLLEAAYRWVTGDRLYTNIFEVNPPLILAIYAIPAWLSLHLVLSDATLLGLLGLLACGFSVFLGQRLIRLHPGFANLANRQTDFVLLLAFVLVVFTAPMYFADREHLFFTLTLPYLLRFCPGLARVKLPAALKSAVGLAGAVGFCIKPHTAVVFLAVQLLYIVRERSLNILWSLENLIIYFFAGLYIGSVFLFLPEYVHVVLPMALATYSAYSRKVNGVLSVILFLVMTGITFADFRLRYQTPFRKDVWYFLGLCAGCLIYGLINNGWSYTYIPLLDMARLLAGWVLLEFWWLKEQAAAKGENTRPFIFGLCSTGLNIGLNVAFYVLCFVFYLQPVNCEKSVACKGAASFFQQAKAHPVHSFGTMSLEFSKWPELVRETRARWDTRFNHLWMLPQFLLSGPHFKEKNAWILDYVARAYAEDLNEKKPDVVYVDVSPLQLKGYGVIDLPGFFLFMPQFKEAWSHYHKTGTIDACVRAPRGEPIENRLRSDCRFDIYSRAGAS